LKQDHLSHEIIISWPANVMWMECGAVLSENICHCLWNLLLWRWKQQVPLKHCKT